MTEQELQHAKEIIAALAPTVQAVLEKSILRALRTHHEETKPTVEGLEPLVFGEVHKHPCGCREGIEGCFSPSHPKDDTSWNPEPAKVGFWIQDPGRNKLEEGQTMSGYGGNAVIRDQNGHLIREFKGKALVPQIEGEREVWAQAYATHYPHTDVALVNAERAEIAAKHADAAVKAFRERYK